jgi:hypothetical protein
MFRHKKGISESSGILTKKSLKVMGSFGGGDWWRIDGKE